MADDEVLDDLIRPFEAAVLEALGEDPNEGGLANLPRILALLKLMEWRDQPLADGVELPPPIPPKEDGQPHWKRRPVLPDVLQVADPDEPPA